MRRLWHWMWEEPEEYRLVTYLFLKGLALIYLVAFVSLAGQIEGIAGREGILPLVEEQAAHTQRFGFWRFFVVPSIFWIDASDPVLIFSAWAGALCAVFLLLGVFPRLMLIALYALYLSFYHAGSLFMNFQWETLLLEAGFLSIFLAGGGSRLIIWLMRWLLFRLRFLSGISKITSGDPTWSGLTALNTYFETQPLPHRGAWLAHQLPEWLLKVGTAGTLVIEILVPFLFLAPRRWRIVGAILTIAFQLAIIATSNHNFFNLLTILLCLFLLDDQALRRLMPSQLLAAMTWWLDEPSERHRFSEMVGTIAAALIIHVSVMQVVIMFGGFSVPAWANLFDKIASSYSISNRYHVFAVMDTERLELVTEWSNDGQTWKPLELKYKPGDPIRAPEFIVPHHPRLDWILWFVPKGAPPFIYAYQRFLERLRQGSKPVLALLPAGTFKDGPPKYLRAQLLHYKFADAATHAKTGRWWEIRYRGPFWLPPTPYKPW